MLAVTLEADSNLITTLNLPLTNGDEATTTLIKGTASRFKHSQSTGGLLETWQNRDGLALTVFIPSASGEPILCFTEAYARKPRLLLFIQDKDQNELPLSSRPV